MQHIEAPRDAIPVSEVARRLAVSSTHIRRMQDAGLFPVLRIGKRRMVLTAEYEQWKAGDWNGPRKQEDAA